MTPSRILAALAVLLLLGGGGAYLLWPAPPPPPEPEVEAKDSGMTDEQTIRLMEEIGYIQQED